MKYKKIMIKIIYVINVIKLIHKGKTCNDKLNIQQDDKNLYKIKEKATKLKDIINNESNYNTIEELLVEE